MTKMTIAVILAATLLTGAVVQAQGQAHPQSQLLLASTTTTLFKI